MTSRIGNNGKRRTRLVRFFQCRTGLSLFEMLVAVAILSSGIAVIYKGLLLTLDYQQHLADRLTADNLLSHQAIRLQMALDERGELLSTLMSERKKITINHHPLEFRFSSRVSAIAFADNFWRVDLGLEWDERNRRIRFSHTRFYSNFYPREEE